MLYRKRCTGSVEGSRTHELLVLPIALVPEVLKEVHDQSGHMGIEKILAKIGDKFWWDAKNWITCCETCSRKMPATKPYASTTNITVSGPMMIAMDFLGPLPQTEYGNKHLLVVADYYIKWVEAYALPDQKATTVAQALVYKVFSKFGVPAILHSDQGRNFGSKLIRLHNS